MPDKITLLLIDIQKDFWEPLRNYPTFKEFPVNVARLISTCRKKGHKIIHVRSVFSPDRSDWMLFYRPEGRGQIPCIAGTEGTEFAEFATPIVGESIIEKQVFDAFVNTELDEILQTDGINTLLISGLETSVCVLFTANSAYLRGYLPLVVTDACADSEERHSNALQMYGDLSFKTISVKQLVDDPLVVENLINDFMDPK